MDEIIIRFSDLEKLIIDLRAHKPDFIRLSFCPAEDPNDPDDIPALLCEAVSSNAPGVAVEDFINAADAPASIFSHSGESSAFHTNIT